MRHRSGNARDGDMAHAVLDLKVQNILKELVRRRHDDWRKLQVMIIEGN
jgi:hypothetical protein